MYTERRDMAALRRLDSAPEGWAPDGLTSDVIDALLGNEIARVREVPSLPTAQVLHLPRRARHLIGGEAA